MMRIRKPFAGAFLSLCVIAALAGFSPRDYSLPSYKQSDKVLHFIAFFLISLAFYWILETSRRKVVQLTFTVCTVALGVASEVVQSFLPIGRDFDPYDVLANVLGSLSAIAICNWYHKRMLERKRAARGYGAVAGDDLDERDVELGESTGEAQETGVVHSVEQELDQWDEHAEDWESTEPAETADGPATHDGGDLGDTKKRSD